MKRRSRRSRKQRQPRPKRKEPTVAELEQELQTLQDHMREGTLTAAECRKLSNLSRTVRLIQEAVANGVAVTELGELIRDPLADHGKPYRKPPSGSDSATRGAEEETEDEEEV
jgi:translation initiation factor IF-2